MSTELQTALLAEINRRYEEHQSKGIQVGNSLVEFTNDARELGILIKQWCGEQITFEFFHKNKDQCAVPLDRLKAFISIANRMQEKATTLEDAKPFIQSDFQAAGLLTMPEQTPQRSIAPTPFVEFTNRIGNAREVVNKWISNQPVEQWDQATRLQVKGVIKPFVELFEML